uniref:Uncharacterized protein n=1 Tax=Arundo donax TaxID=35708 RepID=A0A0A9GF05_ARUDO
MEGGWATPKNSVGGGGSALSFSSSSSSASHKNPA